MRNGAYVLFTYDGKRYKGRISTNEETSINGSYTYLCNNIMAGSNGCDNHFGNEFAVHLGNDKGMIAREMRDLNVTQISKEKYLSHKDPLNKVVFQWNVHKKGEWVEFGCGDVTLRKSTIKVFIKEQPEYMELVSKRDELQAAINMEQKKINDWLNIHKDTNQVVNAVRGRGLKVENVNIEKLKRLFR